jgi:site-specific DNA-methyltransferase (adenine-specific)
MDSSVHYSSVKQDWGTPQSVFAPLHAEFNFVVDVACTRANSLCNSGISFPEYDALAESWAAWVNDTDPSICWDAACWMNPPYGRELKRWVQKAWDEKANGVSTVCLLPARTDTRWWAIFWDHENHCTRDARDEVRFIKGRIRFEGAEHGAPFPSAVVVLRGAVT